MAKQRIHMSSQPVTLEQRKHTQRKHMKPSGLWYSIGQSWIEWVKSEMPHWMGQHNYLIELESSNILLIETLQQLDNFHSEYSCPGFVDMTFIDWSLVADKYDGIEIDPYRWEYRHQYFWYSGWDVASGCLWNLDKTKIKELTTLKNPCARFPHNTRRKS